jgi:uncharacterized protein (DUF2147 family)
MMGMSTIFAALIAVATAPTPIEGHWKNPIGSAIIAIEPCGDKLCGKVVWASARGEREVARHTRQIVGTTVLTGLRRDGAQWTGSLYIPDDDIRVTAHLRPSGRAQLKLTGCGLMGLLCRTQVWTRHEGPLPGGG